MVDTKKGTAKMGINQHIFMNLVSLERQQQDKKWGEQNHSPVVWTAILNEEQGEVAAAMLENDVNGYIRELVQVAAVACAQYESYCRNEALAAARIDPFGADAKSRVNPE